MLMPGEIAVQQEAWDKLCKDAARYRHITAHVIDWVDGTTKRWMIGDQFYDGETLGAAIDASIKDQA